MIRKLIRYYHRLYDVPDWVQWIATNKYGLIRGFYDIPTVTLEDWASSGKCCLLNLVIGNSHELPDHIWKKSLRQATALGRKA